MHARAVLADCWTMSYFSLIAPDFLLILLGLLLSRYTGLDKRVWDAAERLVYFFLFPCLLFYSVVKQEVALGSVLHLVAGGWAIVGTGIALAYACAYLPGVDRRLHASGAQVAFRFNSFVGLAIAQRLGGSEGVSTMAILIAVCVPVCNIAAVFPLARQGGHHLLKELSRNPLILASLGGLAYKALGLPLPELVGVNLLRLGQASVPLGLMAVGAGLQMGALKASPGLASAFIGLRHGVVPALAVMAVGGLGYPPATQMMLVSFAALPTAISAYVLAARMGGDGSFTAGLVAASTLAGALSLPLTLAAWSQLWGA